MWSQLVYLSLYYLLWLVAALSVLKQKSSLALLPEILLTGVAKD